MPNRRPTVADWPALMLDLRRRAAVLVRDARRDDLGAHPRGMADGLRIAANGIGYEIDDPITLECAHLCRCGRGECTACELLHLSHDPVELLRVADDRCACEQARQCDACAIAAVARKEMTLAHPAPAPGSEVHPVGRRGASEPHPDTGGSAT